MVFMNRKPLLQNGGVPLVWYFNSTVTGTLATTTVNFSYTDTRGRIVECTKIRCTSVFSLRSVFFTEVRSGRETEREVYKSIDGWQGEYFRTITFEQPPSGDLLTWLQANATPV